MFVKPLLAVKSANLLIFKQGFANKPPFPHAKAAATLWGRASHAPTIRRRIYAPPAVGAPVTDQATPAALSSATHDSRPASWKIPDPPRPPMIQQEQPRPPWQLPPWTAEGGWIYIYNNVQKIFFAFFKKKV